MLLQKLNITLLVESIDIPIGTINVLTTAVLNYNTKLDTLSSTLPFSDLDNVC